MVVVVLVVVLCVCLLLLQPGHAVGKVLEGDERVSLCVQVLQQGVHVSISRCDALCANTTSHKHRQQSIVSRRNPWWPLSCESSTCVATVGRGVTEGSPAGTGQQEGQSLK